MPTTTRGTGTPSAPRNLTATTLGSIVDLDWDAPYSNGGRSITHYEIHVSVDGGSWSPLTPHTAAGVTAYRDATAVAGGVRHYRVRAWNRNGQGAPAYVTATTAGARIPTAPRNLTATAVSPSVVDLDWDASSSNGGSAITRYEIHVLASGGSWSLLASTTAGVTEYRDTHASAGTLRHYRVRAVNAYGGLGAPAYVDATTAARTPGAPRALTANAVGTSVIELEWRNPLDPGDAAVTGYRIEVSTNGRTWSVRASNNRDTDYRHTGLLPGTTRYYRVAAINLHGWGDWSNVASATTNRPPGRPTGLTARARGTSSIELDWNAPSSTAGTITGYRIEVSTNGRTGVSEANTTQSHRLHPHRPQPRHHPPLPRFGDQHGGQRPLVERRQRHHRCHRSGRTHGPQSGCERFEGKRPAPPHLDAPVHRRRERDQRLPD